MNEENLHVLWLNDGGNLEKAQTVPYQKSSTVRDFIYTLCSPIHHPPHKVRVWLSMKGSVDRTQKIYNNDGWKLLEDKKMTLEEYNVAPNETILVEKQSIDSGIWYFDKIAAEKPQTVHQVPQSSFMTPQLNSQYQHYQISRQQAEMGRPERPPHGGDRSFHSSRIDDHHREMFYQMNDFPMVSSPGIYPMYSSGNSRMMGGGGGHGGQSNMGGGGGGFSHNEDEMLQEVLLMSLKEAKVQEEKKKGRREKKERL